MYIDKVFSFENEICKLILKFFLLVAITVLSYICDIVITIITDSLTIVIYIFFPLYNCWLYI